MPAIQQDAASCEHLTSPNLNPGSTTFQPSTSRDAVREDPTHYDNLSLRMLSKAAAELPYMQKTGCDFEGPIFRDDVIGNCSKKDDVSRQNCQSCNSEAGSSQQTVSYSIINFSEIMISIQSRTEVETHHVTETPQVGTKNTLETVGGSRLNKRKREQTLSLSTQDIDTESSSDITRGSKRIKEDCNYKEEEHSWWMSLKIYELNEAQQRIGDAMSIAINLAAQPSDLYESGIGNLIELLKESHGMLESAKDDMKTEGGEI